MGQVATIGAGEAFVDVLAAKLLARHGPGGQGDLADTLVLVPTRRAVTSLTDALLRASEGRAMLLPTIRPLGDLDEDDPDLMAPDRRVETLVPPAIDGVRRQMLLAQLIARTDVAPTLAVALGLANSLADLLDEVATERLSFQGLKDLAPDQFQIHWQQIIDFLQIVTRHWPGILASEGLIDPAARRDRLTGHLADQWREHPLQTPVYVAGSTGSVPATADLMGAVLAMPQGHIVLPGLDLAMDSQDREAAILEPVHPQHGMLHLLTGLGVAFADVKSWSDGSAFVERRNLLRETLRPAATSERWRDLSLLKDAALEGLRLIEAPGQREEALAIALCLRETLDQPGRTAALVTPDRGLARRVAAEMGRFGVDLDDSAGRSLRLTRAGGYLHLAATAFDSGFAPAEFLALLKHPLASGGEATAAFRRQVRRLERYYLRGLRSYHNLNDLITQLQDREGASVPTWLSMIAGHADGLSACEDDLAVRLSALVRFCEDLAASDEIDGPTRLWRGEDGEVAASAIAGVLQAADVAPPPGAEPLAAILDQLIGSTVVRPRYGQHPRLFILGPLEARLQSFDLTVLGGLNNDVWPATPASDPWMSRPMRADFGLPAPERRMGLQAHDFQQLVGARNVVLTRATKIDGEPTVASRWLLRLQSVIAGAGLTWPLDPRPIAWAGLLDRPPAVQSVPAPTPRPPAEARPNQLPVTAVETLIRDPYAIYAGRILGLRVLDTIDEQPGPRMKGNLLHEVFERLALVHDQDWSERLWPKLADIGEEVFAASGLSPEWQALWKRRLHGAGRWLLKVEAERAVSVEKRLVEKSGRLTGLPDMPDFTLTAKADRLDLLGNGDVVIGDYKTGNPPSGDQIKAGFAVQLPLTALILRSGGFEELPRNRPGALVHIRVDGVRDGGQWVPVKTDDLDALIDQTRDGVAALLNDYANPTTPYRSRPYVQFARQFDGDFDHLARVREWSVAADGAGEGSPGG